MSHFSSDPQIPIILCAPSNLAICPAKIPQAPAAPEITMVIGDELKKMQKIKKKSFIDFFFGNYSWHLAAYFEQ